MPSGSSSSPSLRRSELCDDRVAVQGGRLEHRQDQRVEVALESSAFTTRSIYLATLGVKARRAACEGPGGDKPAASRNTCCPDAGGCRTRRADPRRPLRAARDHRRGLVRRVYRGRDRRLARPVAVKVIKPWWADDGASIERFQGEAQLLARVNDPGIVQIYDFGHTPRTAPTTWPSWSRGRASRSVCGAARSRPPRRPASPSSCVEALGSAHAQGVVHCDVKPANVLLDRRRSREGGRLRRRPVPGRRPRRRPASCRGHASLHVARAGAGTPADAGQRRLQRRRGAIRDARGRAPLPGGLGGGAGHLPPPAGPARAARGRSGPPAGVGGSCARQASGGALPRRRGDGGSGARRPGFDARPGRP